MLQLQIYSELGNLSVTNRNYIFKNKKRLNLYGQKFIKSTFIKVILICFIQIFVNQKHICHSCTAVVLCRAEIHMVNEQKLAHITS